MADVKESPISAAKPPVVNPLSPVGTTEHAATLKLKPVIRKPVPGGAARPAGIRLPSAAAAPAAAPAPAPAPAAAAAVSSASDHLKNITQKLKGVTQQIPQQAILHKTGIIADQDLTEAQKQASKSRTARISLSDALGVAPVKDEAAPMKTIRIKRPTDVQNPASLKSDAPTPAPAEPAAETPVTQRKTLKISRPGAARPKNFGVSKASAAPAAAGGDVPDIADIPDIPAAPAPFAANVCPPDRIPDVPKPAQLIGLLSQIAACAAMGFLAWLLYNVTQLPSHAGGLVF